MVTRVAIHIRNIVLPLAALSLAGCAYGGISGQAPRYAGVAEDVYGPDAWGPEGYDGEWNPAWTGVEQAGDLFGGEDVASVDVFIQPLAPYGRWIETRWGRAFAPDVDSGWRPYTNGRWTAYRLWISDDPWGWATDHYGRWAHDERIGWVWVPDTRWAPHWVAFRENAQFAGWAPLPPQVNYSIGVGFGGGDGFGNGWGFNNFNNWYAPSWVWVPAGAIFRPGLHRNILPFGGGLDYWQATRWQHRTPWTRDGGWAGASGQNYWRGPSQLSSRIGRSLSRPGQVLDRGSPRPQADWNGRPNWQEQRGQRREGSGREGSGREGFGREGWDNRPDRVRGYAPRPAYENGASNGIASTQPIVRQGRRAETGGSMGGGTRRQPAMADGNRSAPVIGGAIERVMGGGTERSRPVQQRTQMPAPSASQSTTPISSMRQEASRQAPQMQEARPAPTYSDTGGRRNSSPKHEN